MRRRLLAAMALAACCAARADGFDQMRAAWQLRLTGGLSQHASDPHIAGALELLGKQAREQLGRMNLDPAATALWADAGDWDNAYPIFASANVTRNYARLALMARAYATRGSGLYQDHALRDAVLHGLDWMDRHHYHARQVYYGNWWDWQIGTPLRLLDTLVLMGDAVPSGLRSRCLAAVDHFVPEADRKRTPQGTLAPGQEGGANLLDKVLVVALSGVLGKSAARVEAARDAISPALPYVRGGDGYYADGSFIQHFTVAYTGNYGVVALEDMARLISLFNAGAWPVRDPLVANVYRWAREAYVPLVYDGAMINGVRGRKISAAGQTDHVVGRSVAAALADLAQSAPAEDARFLRSAVKGWMQRDRSFGPGYLGAPGDRPPAIHDMRLLQEIALDPSIVAAPEPAGVRLYPSMDRAIMRGPGFGLAFSLFSPRISAFEYGNRENARGWWTGIGMLSLYGPDQGQFGGNYWATIDAQRLPGTTTDHSASGNPREWFHYANSESWSGGASLRGQYGVLGMAFSMKAVSGSDLAGKKAWFLMGDKVLALGAGIRASRPAETVVENLKLEGAGRNAVRIDGRPVATAPGRQEVIAGAAWAHIAGNVPGADVGYCFPGGSTLAVLREERSGSWSEIHAAQSSAVVRDRYLSIAVPHGVAQNASYSYLLMPGASAEATAAYCAQPAIVVEANSDGAAAASDRGLRVYAAALWQGGETVGIGGQPLLSTDLPAAVLLREQGGRLELSVSDPTQRADSIVLDLLRPVASALTLDPAIEVLQTRPSLRLRVRVAGAAGRSAEASFQLADDAVVFASNPVK